MPEHDHDESRLDDKLSEDERRDMLDPAVGTGTPTSAPFETPGLTLWERLRLRLPW